MKHTVSVTLIVLFVFLLTQIVGLFVVNNYVSVQQGHLIYKELPLGVERPAMEGAQSLFTIVAAVLIGTALVFVLIKFKQQLLWKIWFLLAVFITLHVAFSAFMVSSVAIVVAAVLAVWKIYKPNVIVHNLSELFIYGGLAAIFVNMLDIVAAVILLIVISAYDAYAVWQSKHMVALAKFQTNSKLFAGVVIPYHMPSFKKVDHKNVRIEKTKAAILGGGDMGFPLLFTAVVFKDLLLTNTVLVSFEKVMIIPVCTTLALGWLLYKAEKDKFYPAMPFISVGCFIGFGLMYVLGFL